MNYCPTVKKPEPELRSQTADTGREKVSLHSP